MLLVGVHEPEQRLTAKRINPVHRRELKRLSAAYWWVVAIGAIFMLARFSEAFLVLRAPQVGLPIAAVPLVLMAELLPSSPAC